ncbi:MAG TPA: O-antigen ligase family protein [Caulobacteraceae bacterium]|nr:O-antigen ligase family protein [Caulobacteraceae bacterium]
MSHSATASRSRTALRILIPAFVGLALVFGGATHGEAVSSAIVRLAAIPILVIALRWLFDHGLTPAARWPTLVLAAAAAIPLLQIIPLPPAIWTHLPQRDQVAQAFAAAGLAQPWLPISLTPSATVDALLSLIPPAAAFLGVLTLDERARRRATLAVIGATLLSAVLSAGQIAAGEDSALRFYSVTNVDSAVGFFANRNHYAALLVITLPLLAYWLAHWEGRGRGHRAVNILIAAGLMVIFVVSLGVTRSRAGIGLGLVAILASALLLWFSRATPKIVPLMMVAALVIGGGLVSAFALQPLLNRLDSSLPSDARVTILPLAIDAAKAYAPLGSGLGSFVPVFQGFERPDGMTAQFINHAHDDYLELLVETGVLGAAVVLAGLAWIAVAGIRAVGWPSGRDPDLPRVAAVVVLLLLAHSLVDYPLRTAAMSVVFAMACGLLTPPSESSPRRRSRIGQPANDLAISKPPPSPPRPYVTTRGRTR